MGVALIAGALSMGAWFVAPAAGGSVAAVTPTTTTVTASRTSVSYDARVLFTVAVTSASGTPTGSVTFVDTSTGSVLDAVALSAGQATFRTASLAPGTRTIVASYGGSASFLSSASSPVSVTVRPGTDATGYQVDAAHDGNQPNVDLPTATLTKHWSVTPGTGGSSSSFSYPIIADNKVFVSGGSPNAIWALDAKTGATDWFTTAACEVGLAYDGHQLFCVTFGGTLTDFNADTGRTLWTEQLPGQYAFSSAPSAWDGMVYASGAGSGGTVYAVSEANGVLQWTQSVENGDDSSPAVNGNGVFVAYACQQDYGFSITGHVLWHVSGECEGGGGDTVSLNGSYVYAIGFAVGSPLILTQKRGATKGTFTSSLIPAFGQGNMYLVNSGDLVAADPSGSPDRWVQGGGVTSTPVADANDVFVGQGGRVVAYSGTGTKIWSASVASGSSVSSVAIGDGLLVAPGGGTVAAFGD